MLWRARRVRSACTRARTRIHANDAYVDGVVNGFRVCVHTADRGR